MDLEEARDVAEMGWPENQKAQRQHDAVDWLIAEVDRLTALCDEYRGERDKLKGELVVKQLTNEQLLSALPRARAEGMEDSAVKVDELKATLEDLALQSRHAVADNAYQRAAYEAELTAASIRKGEQ